jgi:hypothetical protein
MENELVIIVIVWRRRVAQYYERTLLLVIMVLRYGRGTYPESENLTKNKYKKLNSSSG